MDARMSPRPEVRRLPPKFVIGSFEANVCEQTVRFDTIKMKNSLFVWIGSVKAPLFDNLSLAMKNDHDDERIATKLLGADDTSIDIAKRLSKKLDKVVYVSYNLSSDGVVPVPAIEKILHEEIKKNGDRF